MSQAVLITGCSSGIGHATALAALRAGLPTWATARRVEDLEQLAAAGARVLPLDVTDAGSAAAAVKAVEQEHGSVGALVNNAGYGEYGPLEELDLDRVRRQFETNVLGLLGLTQQVLPAMRAAGRGRIVNISSMGGEMTLPGGGAYHASKYAVEALSDALRFEVRPFGVHVVVVQPGPVLTRFADTVLGAPAQYEGPYAGFRRGLDARVRDSYEGKGARLAATPEKVADVVLTAMTARRPRARYKVTAMARALPAARRTLPTPVWDAVLRQQFPSR